MLSISDAFHLQLIFKLIFSCVEEKRKESKQLQCDVFRHYETFEVG